MTLVYKEFANLGNGNTEKLASDLINPFMTHSKVVEEHVAVSEAYDHIKRRRTIFNILLKLINAKNTMEIGGYIGRLIDLAKVGRVIGYENTLWNGSLIAPSDAPLKKYVRYYKDFVLALNRALAVDPRAEICQLPVGMELLYVAA
ncbi:caffeoyl-CoA O-methyltransferase-like protein [Tanacetum coccineum]